MLRDSVEIQKLTFIGEEGADVIVRAHGPDLARRMIDDKELLVYYSRKIDELPEDGYLPDIFYCPRHGPLEVATSEVQQALDRARPAFAYSEKWLDRERKSLGLE